MGAETVYRSAIRGGVAPKKGVKMSEENFVFVHTEGFVLHPCVRGEVLLIKPSRQTHN